jgi:hypothetical protein
VRRALVLLACSATVLAGAGEARATNECRGLMVCVPVAGPWVIVPTTRHVQYQVACPRSYIVGGLDAELSHRAIDVTFPGRLGSPVNPGITTSTVAVFDGFYTGVTRQVTSFRPHIGCIPASGGGGSPPTMISLRPAVFPPGRPLTRRVRTVNAVAGRTTRGAQGCARNERLVGASHAVGFYTQTAPASTVATSVSVRRTVRGGRVSVVVGADVSLRVRAVVQVHALCAGTGR